MINSFLEEVQELCKIYKFLILIIMTKEEKKQKAEAWKLVLEKRKLHKIEKEKEKQLRRIKEDERKLNKLLIEEENNRKNKEKIEKRLQIENIKYKITWKYNITEINTIINLLKEGYDYELIKYVLYNVRNAPYELTQTKLYTLDYMPIVGKTSEHINGRENIGIYVLWAIINKDILDYEDLIKWHKKYTVWIKTESEFNNCIKEHQNIEGAINPDIYINEYEKWHKISLNNETKNKFKEHFLYVKYGTITKKILIEKIKELYVK
jgi:hypothetical protein